METYGWLLFLEGGIVRQEISCDHQPQLVKYTVTLAFAIIYKLVGLFLL